MDHTTRKTAPILPQIESRPNLSDRVYSILRHHIADQQLRGGSRLSVPRLAAQLGVSRTPVKEALERLARDGLVTILPNRGAYVSLLRREDVDEIYQMREMLEGLATRVAAEQANPALISKLADLLRHGEAAVTAGDVEGHIRVDLEFHRLIRERAGNRRLIHALDNLQDQIRIVFRTSAAIPGRMPQALEEHRRILGALRAGDPDEAERAARDHVRRIRASVLAHMKTTGSLSDVRGL